MIRAIVFCALNSLETRLPLRSVIELILESARTCMATR